MTHTIYYTVTEYGFDSCKTTFHFSKDEAQEICKHKKMIGVRSTHIECDESIERIGFAARICADERGNCFSVVTDVMANPVDFDIVAKPSPHWLKKFIYDVHQ